MKKTLIIALLLSICQLGFSQFEICNSPTTQSLWDVYFVNESTGVAVGDSGTIVRSVDEGLNWELIMTNDTVNLRKVKFFDSLNGIAIGSDVFKTSDGGLNWAVLNIQNDYYYDIEIVDGSTCLISGYPEAILKSNDKGENWTSIAGQNINEEIGLLSFVNENIGYSCHYGGGITNKILKTVDGGYNWTTINTESGIDNSIIEAFSFVSEENGFRGGWYNPHLAKSTDGGTNWDFVSYTDSSPWAQIYDFHIEQNQPNTYYACGWHETIIKSVDGGNNWAFLPSVLSTFESFYGIYFIDDFTGWIVGSNGTILKTTNGGGTVGIETVSNNLNLSLFPNPFDNFIEIENPDDLKIELVIITNELGQIVHRSKNSNRISIENLPSKTYFVSLLTEKGVFTAPVIKY